MLVRERNAAAAVAAAARRHSKNVICIQDYVDLRLYRNASATHRMHCTAKLLHEIDI